MRKGILFDLDGTILYTLEDLYLSMKRTTSHFGFPEHSLSRVRQMVGNGIPKLIERAIPNGLSNPQYEEVVAFYKADYKLHMQDTTKPYPGIIELFTRLKKEGFFLAVVSNKFDPATKALCAHYFGDLVDLACGASESIRKKPAPDMVYSVLDSLKLSKDQVLYVGDSDVDIQTAKNAGLSCVAVTWGFRDRDFLASFLPDVIVEDTESLYQTIKSRLS